MITKILFLCGVYLILGTFSSKKIVAEEGVCQKDHAYVDQKCEIGGKKGSCCQKLLINGTLNRDPWYQSMMGVFTIYEELPWILYENRGDISGKYPVYIHNFTDFEPTEERPIPPRVFLYFYLNEIPDYPEMECKDRGCWIISMYDSMPGNYWFGKKWYHIKTKPTPRCPDQLTDKGARFINQVGDIDPGLTIRCI